MNYGFVKHEQYFQNRNLVRPAGYSFPHVVSGLRRCPEGGVCNCILLHMPAERSVYSGAVLQDLRHAIC